MSAGRSTMGRGGSAALALAVAGVLRGWLAAMLIALVRCYQIVVRPILPAVCRFEPSCSKYFIQAVHKYGPVRGTWRGVWRVCRCNPLCRGGFDPP
jgi:putative membrane protein insertion efficiency factor